MTKAGGETMSGAALEIRARSGPLAFSTLTLDKE
jgi:hypothetical protein